jgi:hypothetical protein
MEHHVRIHMLGVAAVLAGGLAVSLITSTAVASRAVTARIKETRRQSQEITVKGSARTRVRSDVAVWRITVTGERPDLQEAFSVLDTGVMQIQHFLEFSGFSSGEVAAGPIATETHFKRDNQGHETRDVDRYTLTRTFTVCTANVDGVAKAAGEVTQFLREGVQVASAQPEYTYSKAADLKVQILGEASKDARVRADEIARHSGCRVTDVRSAQMGVIQITQPNSTEVSGYGIYDTSTIEKDVSVVVTLTLGLSG